MTQQQVCVDYLCWTNIHQQNMIKDSHTGLELAHLAHIRNMGMHR